MGGTQSAETRSVSMENPTPAGIIDISDEVVQRLKKGIKQQAEKEKASEHKASSKEAPPKTPPLTKKSPAPPAPVKAAVQPTVVYQQPAGGMYVMPGGQTITAADVRRQKELELQANDSLWRQRMDELEKTLNKTNVIMEDEYNSAVTNVKQRFANAAPMHQLPPCQDLKAQLIACYRAHPGETLKCSEEVALFNDCVAAHRLKRLDGEKQAKAPAAKAG